MRMLKDVNDNFNALSTVGSFAGLHQRRTAVAVFEVDEEAGLEPEAYALDVKLPANAIICGGVVDVVKTFTSENDTATIAISVAQANDIVAAKAIGAEGDPVGCGPAGHHPQGEHAREHGHQAHRGEGHHGQRGRRGADRRQVRDLPGLLRGHRDGDGGIAT
jgi:hypothetical protein